MNNEESVCHHKSTVERWVTFSNGKEHLESRCEICGKWLRYLPTESAEVAKLPFGKFKGRTYKQVAQNNKDYLEWLVKQDWPNRRTKNLANEALGVKRCPKCGFYHLGDLCKERINNGNG